MVKKLHIKCHDEIDSMDQRVIDFKFEREDIEELTLVFPENLHCKGQQFPLYSLDFSPLESLKKLEHVSIECLITNSLIPILEHIGNVSCISLLKTGPITPSLLEEFTTLERLERLELVNPPGKLKPETLRSLQDAKSLEYLWLDGVVVG